MSMNPEVKAKWVAALRSGKYQQASGTLNDEGRFCCLGVLCEISGLGAWGEHNGDGLIPYETSKDKETDLAPHSVCDWAGFQEGSNPQLRVPTVVIEEEREGLHEHNDAGKTFAEIADAIEEQL